MSLCVSDQTHREAALGRAHMFTCSIIVEMNVGNLLGMQGELGAQVGRETSGNAVRGGRR